MNDELDVSDELNVARCVRWACVSKLYGHLTICLYESITFVWVVSNCLFVGLARTVYIHRIWPYIWWIPCQKYRIHTVYIWFWPTLFVCDRGTGRHTAFNIPSLNAQRSLFATEPCRADVCTHCADACVHCVDACMHCVDVCMHCADACTHCVDVCTHCAYVCTQVWRRRCIAKRWGASGH